jgi:hypothetical protein
MPLTAAASLGLTQECNMDEINRAETSIEIFQKMLYPSDEEVMGHIMLDTLADIYRAADAMSLATVAGNSPQPQTNRGMT